MLDVRQAAHKALWRVLTLAGTRNLASLVRLLPAYSDTVTSFSGVSGVCALTIDDGLSRGGPESSLVEDMRALLKRHAATATFFVCTDYLEGLESAAAAMVDDGHELGHHMASDMANHYARLPSSEFAAELARSSAVIEAAQRAPPRWYRPPQGVLTSSMRSTVAAAGMRTALGDVYCDDWAIADADFVASTMLRQVRDGSVVIVHMPERGFREHTLRALELLLDGLDARGLRCVSLTALERLHGAASVEPLPEV